MVTTMSTIDGYISISQAADIAGVTSRRIRQLISSGMIPSAKRVGSFWLVPEREAHRIAKESNVGRRGRPRGSGKN